MSFQDRVKSILSSDSDESTDTESEIETSPDEPEQTGVVVGEYSWEDYLREYSPGSFRGGDENTVPEYEDLAEKHQHDSATPTEIRGKIAQASDRAAELDTLVDERTVNVTYENEDEFFTTSADQSTVVTRYDLEKTVETSKKEHFEEIDRYWVNKPYAFIILFRSTRENEVKYFAIEPFLNREEERILEFLKSKLQDTIKFSEEATRGDRTNAERAAYIEEQAYKLLFRYNLIQKTPFETEDSNSKDGDEKPSFKQKIGFGGDEGEDEDTTSGSDDSESDSRSLRDLFSISGTETAIVDQLIEEEENEMLEEAVPENVYTPPEDIPELEGIKARPQSVVINDGATELTDYQVMKLMYYLKRDSVSFGKIDPIKHDIGVEDISCDGYNMRVWVYHGDHEQIISNIYHGDKTLDDFVINLAQRSGQGISKRQPQVDVTLPDGSRGQLTLGDEVSDHGTNYTIRQFNDVPFTPIDLINWKTFAPQQMAFLWLCIENHKSLIFAGGTASGKTTSLNAISLFIPSNTKVVSIEDTREVELPQRNWVASVTRASFTEDGVGEVDEFALLEAALRQRPDYIVMGEIRGEEGRTLFQVMSTGHTTYTTFHADSVGEVIKRFTTDPINVSKTLFTALDLVSIQTATRVDGNKVRRNKVLTEINDFSSETNEINVNDVFRWIADEDYFEQTEDSEILETIKFDRGWGQEQLELEIRKRKVVIAYLIVERLNTYTQVAATAQAFINGPEIILDLIANDVLEESLDNLQKMESVQIDIDPEKEEMVPRPEPPDDILNWAYGILEQEADDILQGREGVDHDGKIAELLAQATPTNAETKNADIDEKQTETLIEKLEGKSESVAENNDSPDDSPETNSQSLPEENEEHEDENTVNDDFSGFLDGGGIGTADTGDDVGAGSVEEPTPDEDSEDNDGSVEASLDGFVTPTPEEANEEVIGGISRPESESPGDDDGD